MATVLQHQEWSTSGLIASISRNAFLPANQNTFSQADFIAIMNEELQSRVIPYILDLNENYFYTTVQVATLGSSSKALSVGSAPQGGSNVGYPLPADAIGKRLIDVSAVLASGATRALPMVTDWQVGSPGAYKFGCYIGGQNGDYLYLFPANAFSDVNYLQITYPQAPLALCDDTAGTANGYAAGTASAAMVSGVSTSDGTISLSNSSGLPLGALPATFIVGAGVNFVTGTPQFATEINATISNIGGLLFANQFQISAPASLTDQWSRPTVNVYDWVANQGHSPFLQVPAEIRNLVVQAAVVRCMQALGGDQWQTAEQKMQQMLQSMVPLLKPRISDSPKVLTSANRGIGAWGRRGYFWRGP